MLNYQRVDFRLAHSMPRFRWKFCGRMGGRAVSEGPPWGWPNSWMVIGWNILFVHGWYGWCKGVAPWLWEPGKLQQVWVLETTKYEPDNQTIATVTSASFSIGQTAPCIRTQSSPNLPASMRWTRIMSETRSHLHHPNSIGCTRLHPYHNIMIIILILK
jgi:hypothetical protein